MFDPQAMIGRINAIIPAAYERLEDISSFEYEKACRIVAIILGYCCDTTHATNILGGRRAFKRLPSNWVAANVPSIIAQNLNMDDDWHYRRLLELLKDSDSDLLRFYVAKGLKSTNPEVNEAARDFSS